MLAVLIISVLYLPCGLWCAIDCFVFGWYDLKQPDTPLSIGMLITVPLLTIILWPWYVRICGWPRRPGHNLD